MLEEEDLKHWDFSKRQKRDDAIREQMLKHRSTGGGAADPSAIGHHGHARQFADVVKAIRGDSQPSVDGAEGRRSVEIILAIYKSSESGRPVPLPLANDPALTARRRTK